MKLKEFKQDLFWILLISAGLSFTVMAGIKNQFVTFLVGLLFLYLGKEACVLFNKDKDN